MTEAADRAAVVAEALSFIGTAYHAAGKLKAKRNSSGKITDRGGVNCGSLVYLVYRAAVPDRIPAIDIPILNQQWNLLERAAQSEQFLTAVTSFKGVRELARVSEARPGDLALWRFAHAWAHGAIIVSPGWPWIVHANGQVGQVMRDRGDGGRLARRPMRFFTLW
jgi:cell wall-associated NlpC family hydrolase